MSPHGGGGRAGRAHRIRAGIRRDGRGVAGVAQRLSFTLADAARSLPACSSLGGDLERFARDALAHDRLTGRVGRRICEADSSFAFDSWTGVEVEAWAISIIESGERPVEEMGALADRLRVEGLDALADEVLDVPLAPEPKRGFWRGVGEGLVEGSFDPEPYDDAAGNWGKAIGQLLSGFAIYGDVRDSVAEYSRGNWVGGTFDLAGAAPAIGDGLKLIGFGAKIGDLASDGRRLVEAAHDASKAADTAADAAQAVHVGRRPFRRALARAKRGEWNVPGGLLAHEGSARGHVLKRHVISTRQLQERMARSTHKEFVSSFIDEHEADAAIGIVLSKRDVQIREWLASGKDEITLRADFGGGVGRVLRRGSSSPVSGSRVQVILFRDGSVAWGYFVRTVKIY